ncbi:putative Casein kinase I [Blattamonas nauphoetae]|uniref:Casein kinase I n=1 Tax=Blattamonas nauphoetae TaxID=2049346 RepID=A0ABQ9Y0R5_9EUKA|nr:putative Casein kinase I [Blattamonas nauphoetae]
MINNIFSNIPTFLFNRYYLDPTALLGRGSYGRVYVVTDRVTNVKYACKVEPQGQSCRLPLEYEYLKLLSTEAGFPRVSYFGSQSGFFFLIFDLLGMSLEGRFNKESRRINNEMLSLIGIQAITRLESLHRCGSLHRDIKPENFVFGRRGNKDELFLIDFGLSKNFMDMETGVHIPFRSNKGLVGTPRYAPLFAHLGFEQGRKDDLESLGYCLMYLQQNDLPWMRAEWETGTEISSQIGRLKMGLALEAIGKECPMELVEFVNYTKGLDFESTPNYHFLKSLLFRVGHKQLSPRSFLSPTPNQPLSEEKIDKPNEKPPRVITAQDLSVGHAKLTQHSSSRAYSNQISDNSTGSVLWSGGDQPRNASDSTLQTIKRTAESQLESFIDGTVIEMSSESRTTLTGHGSETVVAFPSETQTEQRRFESIDESTESQLSSGWQDNDDEDAAGNFVLQSEHEKSEQKPEASEDSESEGSNDLLFFSSDGLEREKNEVQTQLNELDKVLQTLRNISESQRVDGDEEEMKRNEELIRKKQEEEERRRREEIERRREMESASLRKEEERRRMADSERNREREAPSMKREEERHRMAEYERHREMESTSMRREADTEIRSQEVLFRRERRRREEEERRAAEELREKEEEERKRAADELVQQEIDEELVLAEISALRDSMYQFEEREVESRQSTTRDDPDVMGQATGKSYSDILLEMNRFKELREKESSSGTEEKKMRKRRRAFGEEVDRLLSELSSSMTSDVESQRKRHRRGREDANTRTQQNRKQEVVEPEQRQSSRVHRKERREKQSVHFISHQQKRISESEKPTSVRNDTQLKRKSVQRASTKKKSGQRSSSSPSPTTPTPYLDFQLSPIPQRLDDYSMPPIQNIDSWGQSGVEVSKTTKETSSVAGGLKGMFSKITAPFRRKAAEPKAEQSSRPVGRGAGAVQGEKKKETEKRERQQTNDQSRRLSKPSTTPTRNLHAAISSSPESHQKFRKSQPSAAPPMASSSSSNRADVSSRRGQVFGSTPQSSMRSGAQLEEPKDGKKMKKSPPKKKGAAIEEDVVNDLATLESFFQSPQPNQLTATDVISSPHLNTPPHPHSPPSISMATPTSNALPPPMFSSPPAPPPPPMYCGSASPSFEPPPPTRVGSITHSFAASSRTPPGSAQQSFQPSPPPPPTSHPPSDAYDNFFAGFGLSGMDTPTRPITSNQNTSSPQVIYSQIPPPQTSSVFPTPQPKAPEWTSLFTSSDSAQQPSIFPNDVDMFSNESFSTQADQSSSSFFFDQQPPTQVHPNLLPRSSHRASIATRPNHAQPQQPQPFFSFQRPRSHSLSDRNQSKQPQMSQPSNLQQQQQHPDDNSEFFSFQTQPLFPIAQQPQDFPQSNSFASSSQFDPSQRLHYPFQQQAPSPQTSFHSSSQFPSYQSSPYQFGYYQPLPPMSESGSSWQTSLYSQYPQPQQPQNIISSHRPSLAYSQLSQQNQPTALMPQPSTSSQLHFANQNSPVPQSKPKPPTPQPLPKPIRRRSSSNALAEPKMQMQGQDDSSLYPSGLLFKAGEERKMPPEEDDLSDLEFVSEAPITNPSLVVYYDD